MTEAQMTQRLLAIVTELRTLHSTLPREAAGPEAFPREQLLYDLAVAARLLERVGARWGVRAQEASDPARPVR